MVGVPLRCKISQVVQLNTYKYIQLPKECDVLIVRILTRILNVFIFVYLIGN